MARKTSPKTKTGKPAKSPRRGREQPHVSAQATASEQGEIRSGAGRFQKGRSGNPGGRPKELAEVKELARAHTVTAIERLAHWMMSDDPKAAIMAANSLLDRAWGKATQPVSNEDGKPFVVNLVEVRAALSGKFARIASTSAAR